MEIRQLHYFLVLCDQLNYTRAAQKLYLTRQALRQSIAVLEREMGEPLFFNERNHLSLTERGQWLRHRAQPVVQSFDQLQEQIAVSMKPSGPVRLGISVALVPDYLPRLPFWLEQIQVLYPNLGLEIQLLPNDTVITGVEEGSLSMGLIMDLEPASYAAQKQVLRRDPLSLLAARDHPLAEYASLSLAQLDGQRLLMPGVRPEPFGPLLQAFQAAGCSPVLEVAPSFYEANYQVRRQGSLCVTRPEDGPRSSFSPTRDLLLPALPPICASFLWSCAASPAIAALVRHSLSENAVQLR